MREILFRGKNTDNDKWKYGSLLSPNEFNEIPYIVYIDYLNEYGEIGEISVSVIPETVGQYTGLVDKNGRKIFEGDIVKTHYANAQKSDFIEQVVFHNGKFCAYFSNQLCKQWANLYDGTEHLPQDKSVYMDSVEVIGNIHDNPEILKTPSL